MKQALMATVIGCGALLPFAALTQETNKPAAEAPYKAEPGNKVDAATLQGFRVVRQFDCARCHGKDFNGQVGPSLIASIKEREKQTFQNLILDGNITKGMPPYKSHEIVTRNIDGIYAYFMALADAAIEPGALSEIGK